MSDKVLQALADKLGVAVEYLWAALLRQAPIAGFCDLLFAAAVGVGLYWWVRWVRWAYKERLEDMHSAWFGIGLGGAVLAVMVIIVLLSLQNTIAAFFNPSYWALVQVKP